MNQELLYSNTLYFVYIFAYSHLLVQSKRLEQKKDPKILTMITKETTCMVLSLRLYSAVRVLVVPLSSTLRQITTESGSVGDDNRFFLSSDTHCGNCWASGRKVSTSRGKSPEMMYGIAFAFGHKFSSSSPLSVFLSTLSLFSSNCDPCFQTESSFRSRPLFSLRLTDPKKTHIGRLPAETAIGYVWNDHYFILLEIFC